MKELSYCITCKNRLWQIKRTLPRNLNNNRDLKSKIEFILIDFGSTDGLGSWIKNEFKSELKEGYLKYIFTERLSAWHASIAKNTAHLFASGKIVTNLDCDNYTGKDGGRFILNCFQKHEYPIMVHQFSGNFKDGSFGRISLNREVFLSIGGYDEQFFPMGFQDLDLLVRLWLIGIKYIPIKNRNFNKAIPNTKKESIALCNSDLDYLEMNWHNRCLSLQNVRKSRDPLRNNGNFGINSGMFDHQNSDIAPTLPKRLDCSELVKKLGLKPPEDLSYMMNLAFGENELH